MKITAFAALTFTLSFASTAMAAIEEPAFETLRAEGDFELRLYAPTIVAETLVEGDMDSASNSGFRVIASYIFGNNLSATGSGSEKIAMTAPVTMQAAGERIAMTAPVTTEGEAGRLRMQFVMPSRYTLASLPKPKDERVTLREVPAQRMAVMKFSGFAGAQKVEARTRELLDWMKAEGLEPQGGSRLARYDPPWTLPFLRRNEVMVPVR
jgi:hypothetical protein